MLHNVSQLLLRNQPHFDDAPLLISQSPRDQLAREWEAELLTHNTDFVAWQLAAKVLGERAQFGPAPQGVEVEQAVLVMPKSKDEARMLLAALAALLPVGGRLLLAGENKAGIKSAAKLLEPYGAPMKIDSARHCSLFEVTLTEKAPAFDLADWQQQFELEVAGESLKVVSLPGVFSHGELDTGTRLLLESLPRVKTGRILDFGCGAGVIGTYLAKKAPQAQVEMLDVSALAIKASELTLEANGITNAKVTPSDGLSALTGRFHQIISNPPFHTGVGTDYSATEQLIAEAPKRLVQGGDLVLVANRFLKYEPLLAAGFNNKVDTLATSSQFKILYCRGSGR
ncbi:methyltransferase [Gallaecimonas kandeliae]|uniref:methyltransferase n=1 Tax=Gallaecimonas kandeliae TaxID=3029055 RepID=UPI0026487482|nr:methyltransferase [Gallaecimonas kandeliae]WKE66150.1 methyltransferase [Gallaecimonas kandeliae]